MSFIADNVYFFVIYLVKLSILITYLRIFSSARPFRFTVYAIIFIHTAGAIVNFGIFWTAITPIACNWRPYVNPVEFVTQCTPNIPLNRVFAFYSFFVTSIIVMDLVIFVLPIHPVWKLNMAKKHKMIVLGILISGITYEPLLLQRNIKFQI